MAYLTAAQENSEIPRYPREAGTRVRVLEEDPELGAGLGRADWEQAVVAATAPVFSHPNGRWRFSPRPDAASLGILILSGVIVIRIDTGERAHIELLGEGDVTRPWVGMAPDLALSADVTATVVSEVRMAALDRPFALRTARWPEIQATLMERLIARSRRLSLQSAINGLTRIEERLELTLWQLASRFGRVTSDGYKLSLRLTHTQLAEVVAAQRPSVTTALVRLEQSGRLVRNHDGWILPGSPPAKLKPLTQHTGVP
jgi:CRP/FNR family transcriptional regulator, cyclic AMP receptor protein